MRKSKIWTISKEELELLVKKHTTISGVLRDLGLKTKGTTNFTSLRKRFVEEGIEFSHIPQGNDSNKGRKFGPSTKKIPLEEILVVGSTYSRTSLKKRLLDEGLLENKCCECGLPPKWNGKPLKLQLDHANGDPIDNRLENLRIICPNCHSQTPTFSGKKLKKERVAKIDGRLGPQLHRRKVERPSLDVLLQEIADTNYCAVGRKYGVTDKAVRRWVGK